MRRSPPRRGCQAPELPSARPYNAVIGHLVGLGSGYACVFALGLGSTPSVFVVHTVVALRVAAAVLAIALASGLELLLRAQHPPGAATTLLAALGSFRPTWHDAGAVLAGVIVRERREPTFTVRIL